MGEGRTRFVLITGGVSSSLGKGIAAASLGRLLAARGYTVRNAKLDPYLNIDPGTLNPSEHGEVFVTHDGGETDLDLGHYERFVGTDLPAECSVTAGQVYSHVLGSERRGDYLGHTVQVIPHVTDEIQRRVQQAATVAPTPDVLIVEVGGTVGDIEIQPFLEAIRQLRASLPSEDTCSVHLTLVPTVGPGKELKSKPSQHSVAALRSFGIVPDVLLARSSEPLDDHLKAKLARFCGLRLERVIAGLDASSIYAVVGMLADEGFDTAVLAALGLDPRTLDLGDWDHSLAGLTEPGGGPDVSIGIVCKYHDGHDEYLSVVEALRHAAALCGRTLHIEWITTEELEADRAAAQGRLGGLDGVVVPGGFGHRGVEGKILTASLARQAGLPYLGLCLGLQVAIVEFARHVAGLEGATSGEWDAPGPQVVALLESQAGVEEKGGTMRLGDYPAVLAGGTKTAELYGKTGGGQIVERHRHRFEVNPAMRATLEAAGLVVSGESPDGRLVEFVELADHPYFVATQAHPEFTSRPGAGHPLFLGLVEAAAARHDQSEGA
jgi:CTP synthase